LFTKKFPGVEGRVTEEEGNQKGMNSPAIVKPEKKPGIRREKVREGASGRVSAVWEAVRGEKEGRKGRRSAQKKRNEINLQAPGGGGVAWMFKAQSPYNRNVGREGQEKKKKSKAGGAPKLYSALKDKNFRRGGCRFII